MAGVVPELLEEVRIWMLRLRIPSTGAPFVRYREIAMPHRLDIEVCMPIAAPVDANEEFISDVLPAGRYAVLVHSGAPQDLIDANAMLQKWAEQQGITFRSRNLGASSTWEARTETYMTDPDAEAVNTEIAYLVG